MEHDPTTTAQEERLFEEQLAHEYGVVLAEREEQETAEDDVDDVVFPYAYALESVVT